jgi:hypothetical protein
VVNGELLEVSGENEGVDEAWLDEAKMGAGSRSSIASSSKEEARPHQ